MKVESWGAESNHGLAKHGEVKEGKDWKTGGEGRGSIMDAKEDLKAQARAWFDKGFNVVAIRFEIDSDGKVAKKPFTEWSKWQNERQTEEEFEAQPWDKADGYGIVCSFPNNEGLYLAVVDYDVKKVTEEARKAGAELLKRFPITRRERTISGGIHYVYYSRVKPQPVSETHDTHALELIGGPRLCVMAPSKGYTLLNDNLPRTLEDVEGLFWEILRLPDPRGEAGANGPGRKFKDEDKERGRLEDWLEVIKEKLSIAGEGTNWIYVHCPFHSPDKHPSFALNKQKFYGIDYHDGKSYSLRDLAKKLEVPLPEEGGEEEGEEEGAEKEAEDEGAKLYDLALRILEEAPMKTERRTYLMYRWNGRWWADDAEGYIHQRLVAAEGKDFKPHHLTTLTQMVQGLTMDGADFEEPPRTLVNLENGVLNLETCELCAHDPKFFFLNMIHASYDPEARADRFLGWLEEIQPDPEDRLLVQEIAGYLLLRDYPLHSIFFFVGPGRNGKGTLLRTLESILGKENCVSIALERLGERFQNTNLMGKLLNVVSEPKADLFATEPVKAATGQDLLYGEIKNKQKPIPFHNYAKFIVMANRLPPVSDTTPAWWERVIVVEFPVTIPEERRIENIERLWLEDPKERSGILNWMLEGLRRLLRNGRFTKTKGSERMAEEYKKWSNPIEYFLSKYCIIDGKSITPKEDLYEAYKKVCEMEGLPVADERAFSIEVKRKPFVNIARRRMEGERRRCWIGLRLDMEKVEKEGEGEWEEEWEEEREWKEEGDQEETKEGGGEGAPEGPGEAKTVPDVPDVPGFCNSLEKSEIEIEEEKEGEDEREFFNEFKTSGTPGTPGTVPALAPKPLRPTGNPHLFLWRRIQPAEPCEFCGRHPVEYEVATDSSILRRCHGCFEALRQGFGKVELRRFEEDDG